jgi:hypothetical protein
MRLLHTTLIAALLVAGSGAGSGAQTPAAPPQTGEAGPIFQDLVATQAFQHEIDRYVVLHRLLETFIPPLRITRDLSPNYESMRVLRLRIQLARRDARQGDFFTAGVATMIRRQVTSCLTREEWQAVLDDNGRNDEEEMRVEPPVLQVNMEWPEPTPFDFVPPQLLRSLPPLPEELQYRIIGRSLVLWDHHANLIVDILPAAFGSTT